MKIDMKILTYYYRPIRVVFFGAKPVLMSDTVSLWYPPGLDEDQMWSELSGAFVSDEEGGFELVLVTYRGRDIVCRNRLAWKSDAAF